MLELTIEQHQFIVYVSMWVIVGTLLYINRCVTNENKIKN